MRKLLQILAVIAILNVWGNLALAQDPTVSAQPDVRPDPAGSTTGGSASASGGSAGPATVASSEPITASSSNTGAPNAPARGSTSATGPGTRATVPTTAFASQPNPSAPDGSAPAPTTSGPTANADASRSSMSTSDGHVRANAVANVTGAFAGSLAGIGSAEDPTYASTCSTADATPGVPTDASLGTNCGSAPSSASEDFSASGTDGNGGGGSPSGSTCLGADASAGASPTTDLSSPCTTEDGTTPSTATDTGDESGARNAAATTGSGERLSREAASVLGILGLPSTATEPTSVALLGAILGVAGAMLLRQSRPKN